MATGPNHGCMLTLFVGVPINPRVVLGEGRAGYGTCITIRRMASVIVTLWAMRSAARAMVVAEDLALRVL